MIWTSLFSRYKRKPQLQIYSKADCPLCDELEELLHQAQNKVPFESETIKLEDDPDAFELYKYEVPVVFIDGKKRFFGKVEKSSLLRALRIAAKS